MRALRLAVAVLHTCVPYHGESTAATVSGVGGIWCLQFVIRTVFCVNVIATYYMLIITRDVLLSCWHPSVRRAGSCVRDPCPSCSMRYVLSAGRLFVIESMPKEGSNPM